MSGCFQLLWFGRILGKREFSEVRAQKLTILEHAERTIVLSQIKVETLPHVQCLQGHNELLLQLDVLRDSAHTLLTCIPAEVVDELEVLRLWLLLLLAGLFLLLISLLLEHLIVLACYLRLEPAARVEWIIVHLDLEFDV